MRTRVHESNKAKARAISLHPHQNKFVEQRAFTAGVTVSRYFQLLSELDRRENILPRAMTINLDTQPAA